MNMDMLFHERVVKIENTTLVYRHGYIRLISFMTWIQRSR